MKCVAASALSIVGLLALTTLSDDITLSDHVSIQRSVMLSRVSSTKADRMKIISSEEGLQNSDVNEDADVQTSSLGEIKGVRSKWRSRKSEGRGRRAQNQDHQKDFPAVPDSGKLKDAWWYKEYMDHSVPNTQNMRWSSAFAPEGSSSRTRSAYEKYLFASQMSNYAVKHGAQQIIFTTSQLLPCMQKGVVHCQIS